MRMTWGAVRPPSVRLPYSALTGVGCVSIYGSRWAGAMASDSFGALLRTSRLRAGLTQLELAARSGLTVAAIRDLEQGRSRRPQPRSVGTLIDALGATGSAAAELRARAA